MNTMMQPLYDKALSRGIASLSDEELLTLLVEEPGVAASVLRSCGGSLASVRALRLLAAAEFGRRVAESRAGEADVIATSDDVVHLFRPKLQRLDHEECWVLYLTSSNRIVERQRVSQGGVQGTVVDHRLIIKRALELLATQLIMVHNHPSGAAEPSPQDKVLTERIARAAALFDIRLLDHLIISREGDFSFLREGLLH